MDSSTLRQVIPLGLWELDAVGRVLHYEPETDCAFQPSEVIGRSFFDEVMPAAKVQELRDQVERFIAGPAQAHSFDLDLRVGEENVRTRNLLGRISGKGRSRSIESILLHIRIAANEA